MEGNAIDAHGRMSTVGDNVHHSSSLCMVIYSHIGYGNSCQWKAMEMGCPWKDVHGRIFMVIFSHVGYGDGRSPQVKLHTRWGYTCSIPGC